MSAENVAAVQAIYRAFATGDVPEALAWFDRARDEYRPLGVQAGLGVATHRRTDCPAADTGRPAEPSIRDAMSAPFKLVIGLSPDELGYIVPGYDFYPANIFDEQRDPCDGQEYDPRYPRRRVPTHYHEVLSVGVEAASYVTCTAVALLQGPEAIVGEPACDALP